jgi:hypothetical protein
MIRHSTRFAIASLIAAAIVFAAGTLNTWRLEWRADQLQARCEATYRGSILCYPDGLGRETREDHPTAGLMEASDNIYLAAYDAQHSRRWPKLTALAIVIAGCLPWTWYFLLRRLAEVRAAIGGKSSAE